MTVPDMFSGIVRFVDLTPDARHTLRSAARIRRLKARDNLLNEGDVPGDLEILVEGWACQYKTLADGRRQIMALLLPGDLWNVQGGSTWQMDYSVAALTPLITARIPQWKMQQLVAAHSGIAMIEFSNLAFAASLQNELTISLGRRTGLERVGHLLCEILYRQASVNMATPELCPMPLTQGDLGDMVGITSIHTNRLLQELRGNGLITLRNRVLTVHDLPALEEASHFNPDYLLFPNLPPHHTPHIPPALYTSAVC